ncbi:NRDE family protein [Gordonia alkanivorans]|uniref:NRDE family protein n=1 Tax=Gordonia alkanivorans TaxID=84096 RepID=UPI002448D25E|nr:NRDE family protein [Gordonia alkanivorans]MDH3018731.1 NRDE family protein [Gordonia alkanivorans]MDJ0026729.1 NRDE family protein [Gordonia alkanivorans]
MCLILFAWNAHPEHRLIVAANRDEYHRRRTYALSRWDELPIIAGRDALAGGTWMGVSADVPGRVAMVTNVRVGPPERAGVRSRGQLPVDFLDGDEDPKVFADRVVEQAADYDPVNLLIGDATDLWWVTNRPAPHAERVADGVHGVSNGALDNDWPKVADGTVALRDLISDDDYFSMLADQDRPDPVRLPDTGVGAEFEAALSSKFINIPGYGTRASTLLRIGHDGHGAIVERRYGYRGKRRGTTRIAF